MQCLGCFGKYELAGGELEKDRPFWYKLWAF